MIDPISKKHIGPVKLHLGCQEKYLEGYINIDLPPEAHTVREARVDVEADVRELDCPAGSVDEIRSHHLLEHFSRQEALLLLARWHKWLKIGGLLHVETPDFEESAKKFIAGTSTTSSSLRATYSAHTRPVGHTTRISGRRINFATF